MLFHINAMLFQLMETEKEVDQIDLLQAWKINNGCIDICPASAGTQITVPY